jgi:branched-chain amino acid transport system permease protein
MVREEMTGWLRKYLVYIVIFAVAIVLPLIFRDAYLRHLLVMTCIYAVMSLGMNMVVGYMREISLGHSLFFGFGAYASTLLALKLGLSVWLSALIGILLTGLVGLIIGYISISRTRNIPFAIVTFGFGLVGLLICSNWFELTNSQQGIGRIPPPTIAIPGLPSISFQSPEIFYYLALACLIFVIFLTSRVLKSRIGRSVIALRENPDVANSIGVNALQSFVFIFALSAIVLGLSGAMYAHFIRYITPKLMGLDYILVMLIMVIVGGRGTIAGPILGAAIFIIVPEFLRVADQLRAVIFGVIFLVCIVFMPQGVYPALVSLWQRVFPKLKLRFQAKQKG